MQAIHTVIPDSVNRFWKFYPFREKNILGKQLSQAICSKYNFRLLHVPKFHGFSTKLNMMVKVVKLFTGVLWKSCSDELIGKNVWGSLFFNKVSRLQARERLLHRCFPVSFTKYFRTLFLQNTSGWLLLLNALFSLRRPQSQKMFPSTLVILNIFDNKHRELLANTSLWMS